MEKNCGDSLVYATGNVGSGVELFAGVINSLGFTTVTFSGPIRSDAVGMDAVYYGYRIPEPTVVILMDVGLVGLGCRKRKAA
jgi:hypothetical protein